MSKAKDYDTLSRVIPSRFTEKEGAAIDSIAAQETRTVANVIRVIVIDALRNRGMLKDSKK